MLTQISVDDLQRIFNLTTMLVLTNKSSAVAEMGDRLAGGGAGFPCNTTSPGPRSTSAPSGTLIHPTVGPQYTNVTDRKDNGSIAHGEPLLVTVAQKLERKMQQEHNNHNNLHLTTFCLVFLPSLVLRENFWGLTAQGFYRPDICPVTQPTVSKH